MKLSELARGGGQGGRKPMYAGGSQTFDEAMPRSVVGGFLGEPSRGQPGGPSMDPPHGQPHWSSMRNDILTDANGNRTRQNPGLTSWDFMRGPNQPIGQGPANDSPVPPADPMQGDQFDNNWGPLNGQAGGQPSGQSPGDILQQILGGNRPRQGLGGGAQGGLSNGGGKFDIGKLLAMLRGG